MNTIAKINEPQFSEDTLLTVSEFCRLANVSRTTFYRRREQGDMPRLTYVGRSPRIRMTDYRDWVNALPRSI